MIKCILSYFAFLFAEETESSPVSVGPLAHPKQSNNQYINHLINEKTTSSPTKKMIETSFLRKFQLHNTFFFH